MSYPFSRLTFKDSDYKTKIPKACTDQIRTKNKRVEGRTMVHIAVRVCVSSSNYSYSKQYVLRSQLLCNIKKKKYVNMCKSRVFTQINKLLECRYELTSFSDDPVVPVLGDGPSLPVTPTRRVLGELSSERDGFSPS
jgi:hypothetical protein